MLGSKMMLGSKNMDDTFEWFAKEIRSCIQFQLSRRRGNWTAEFDIIQAYPDEKLG
jgi:hypothetical protein